MANISWKSWYPGLDNDHLTLQAVRDTLPGNPPEEINIMVRIFENPKSPLAFRGAISLQRHDCVHILLGRGLLPQDEAFVIGYTMGTAPFIMPIETCLFKLVSHFLYPAPYDFSFNDLKAYDIGIKAGKESNKKSIYHFPIENYGSTTLGELRQMLGINKDVLKQAYQEEKRLLPDTKSSKRLSI